MRLLDAYKKLEELNEAAVQTRDAAGILQIETVHASKILERLGQAGLVVFLKKGLWAFPKRMEPLLLPRYCAAPFACYVSLQSALYQHDMILQVPSVIYAVSLARTKLYKTALGTVSLHHIDPSFFFGYIVDPITGIALATPEKALLDFLYLSGTKSQVFCKLPELELPKKFSYKKACEMIERIPSLGRKAFVRQRFEELIHQNTLS
jgi:predicted transcriptional regulator of viral defense system